MTIWKQDKITSKQYDCMTIWQQKQGDKMTNRKYDNKTIWKLKNIKARQYDS